MPTSVLIAVLALSMLVTVAYVAEKDGLQEVPDTCDVAKRPYVKPMHRQEQYVCQVCLASFTVWDFNEFGTGFDLMPSVCPHCGRKIARIIDVGGDAR